MKIRFFVAPAAGASIDSALPSAVLRAPAEPGLALDSALPSGVLRAPAEPWLAIAAAIACAARAACRASASPASG